MSFNYYEVTQDFIMSEMARKQTNQLALNCEFQNWLKIENVRFCESDRKNKNELMEKAYARILEISRPVRKSIANGLIDLANHIATA